jgi:uncharacterized protein (TIGR03083 family)
LVDQARAGAALRAATEQAAGLLRAIPDPDRRLPNSEWTVGEAAAHMVLAGRVFAGCARGEASPVASLDAFADVNRATLAAFPQGRVGALAASLVEAGRALLDATAGRSGAEPTPWHGGHQIELWTVTAIAVGHLLTHGYDIARAIGRPWPIDPGQARLVDAGTLRVMPLFVVVEAARDLQASYEVRLRGGPRFTCCVDDGALTVEPRSAGPVDCRISADPAAFLLVSWRRTGQWGPIARGQMVAWGRKPWLALRFASLIRAP